MEYYNEEFPVTVTFHFKNEEERDLWIKGLQCNFNKKVFPIRWDHDIDINDFPHIGITLDDDELEIMNQENNNE